MSDPNDPSRPVLAAEALPAPPTQRTSRGWTWPAWIVILVAVGAVIAHHNWPGSAPIEDAAPAQDAKLAMTVFELQGRYIVGAHVLLGAQAPSLADEVLQFNKGSVDQRLRAMVLIAEMREPAEALKLLDQFDVLCRDNHIKLTETQARVRRVLGRLYGDYTEGDFKARTLAPEDKVFLEEELGWFGTLALHPQPRQDQNADSAEARDAAIQPALRTLFAIVGASVIALFAILVGFVGLIVFVVWVSSGGVTWRLQTGSPFAGVYAETFALWLVGYGGMMLAGPYLPGEVPRLLQGAGFMVLSLGVIAWPLVRGVSWTELRQDIGLTYEKNPLVEIAAGIAGYVIALPVVAVGFGMTLTMILLQAHWNEQGAGGPGSEFSSSPGPAHPIIQYLADGDWLSRLQIYFLASVVAPVVEEIMFRGFLYRSCRESTHRLKRFGSVLFSATVVSFLFAAIHPQGLVTIPPLMALALGFSIMREWRGSLLPSMFAHGMSNGFVATIAMIALSR